MIYQWFDLKTTGTVFFGLGSKLVAMVFSGLTSKLVATVFFDLTSKPVATISWLSLKTKVVKGFSVWVLKPITTV
jgi:hypothetical protein